MTWYFYATADFFGGFIDYDPKDPFGWHGPYKTFTEAKVDAIEFYRDVAKTAQQNAKEIKKTTKPTIAYQGIESDAERDARLDARPSPPWPGSGPAY